MSRVARHLHRHGYTVHNWTYRSMRKQIAYHADRLLDELARIGAQGPWARVHFVTHSLGGIVVRHMLCHSPSIRPHIGRIVMLAPPNSGSHVARFGSAVLRGLCPTLREISDRQTSFVNRLSEPQNVEIGIIAGSGDWVVRRSSTHLRNERDYIVVRGGHLRLPFLRASVDQTAHFLRHGTFKRECPVVGEQAR
jgi:pimeloyl-ACP methyl ester carboxylesterase